MTSHVDEQVQAAIAAARSKRQQRRQQRAELDENRAHGLEARHSAKIRRWAAEDDDSGFPSRGDTTTTGEAS